MPRPSPRHMEALMHSSCNLNHVSFQLTPVQPSTMDAAQESASPKSSWKQGLQLQHSTHATAQDVAPRLQRRQVRPAAVADWDLASTMHSRCRRKPCLTSHLPAAQCTESPESESSLPARRCARRRRPCRKQDSGNCRSVPESARASNSGGMEHMPLASITGRTGCLSSRRMSRQTR